MAITLTTTADDAYGYWDPAWDGLDPLIDIPADVLAEWAEEASFEQATAFDQAAAEERDALGDTDTLLAGLIAAGVA